MIRSASAVILSLFLPSLAYADSVWAELSPWTIAVSSDDASKCYATRTLEGGSVVQIGTEPSLEGGFFAIYNSAWTHVEDGYEGEIEFDFGVSRFGGDVVGRIENGLPGGYAYFNNPEFVKEFSRRQTVNIKGKRGAEFELDLTGTSKAVRAVLACQDAQPDAAQAE